MCPIVVLALILVVCHSPGLFSNLRGPQRLISPYFSGLECSFYQCDGIWKQVSQKDTRFTFKNSENQHDEQQNDWRMYLRAIHFCLLILRAIFSVSMRALHQSISESHNALESLGHQDQTHLSMRWPDVFDTSKLGTENPINLFCSTRRRHLAV